MKSLFVFFTSLLVLLGSVTMVKSAFGVLDHVSRMHSIDLSNASQHHHGHIHHDHERSNSSKSKKSHSHEMDLLLNPGTSILERREVINFVSPHHYFDLSPFREPSLKHQTYPFRIFRPPISQFP